MGEYIFGGCKTVWGYATQFIDHRTTESAMISNRSKRRGPREVVDKDAFVDVKVHGVGSREWIVSTTGGGGIGPQSSPDADHWLAPYSESS